MPRPPARIPRLLRDLDCRVRRAAPPSGSSADPPAIAMTPVGAQPLLLLVAGLVIDALLGDMPVIFRYVPHPVILAGRATAFFDRKLNRESRSEASRRERGIITVIVLVGGAVLLGLAVERVCRGSLVGAAVEAFMIAVLVAQRSLYEHVAAVAAALATGGLAGGREAVRHIVGRDPTSLDEHGVARAAIESLAENFSDGVVAPVFWYLLLGLPGLFAYKMANTLDSMIGHRTPRYRAFGWAAARLDDVLNTVPAPLSGGVRQERSAGSGAHDHAARRAQAPFAQCGLAGKRDGRGARFGTGGTAPLPRGSGRRSVARRRQRPGRGLRHLPGTATLPTRLLDRGRAAAGSLACDTCYAARLSRGGRSAAKSAERSRLCSR